MAVPSPGCELEALARGFATHERAGRLHLGRLGLDGHDPAALADRLGQPERVEPDAAAHVEPARAGGQPQLADDSPRVRLLEPVHALERDVGTGIGGAHRAPCYQTAARDEMGESRPQRSGRLRYHRRETMIRLVIVLLTAALAALGLIVGVVVALGVAWIAVALPVLLLLGLAAALVALRRRLWPRADDPPA